MIGYLFLMEPSHALTSSNINLPQTMNPMFPAGTSNAVGATIAYRTLDLEISQFGEKVPVGMWYPAAPCEINSKANTLTYRHRISVKRIGQLLAGWNFIPELLSRNYELEPSLGAGFVIDGAAVNIPTKAPVVLLAHGYLGSRFDLSHLAEALAQEGFICVSPEYPESLAASYNRVEGLDRQVINNQLLRQLSSVWNIQATSYGIVGHSLGCGTAITTGDSTWARVCIAGFPRQRDGSPIPGDVLLVMSVNDGAVSLSRFGGKDAIPSDFSQLEEAELNCIAKLPRRSSLVFDRADAPNHISFLANGVNEAMIELLSPLLPIAQALKIPVLDFDKYKESRDSRQTAKVVIPLVISYLKQLML